MYMLPPTLAPDLARAVMSERRHEADRSRLARQARAGRRGRPGRPQRQHPQGTPTPSHAFAHLLTLLTVLAAGLGTALVLVVTTAGARLP